MLSSPEFDALNSVKYLYLRDLSEPRDNSLRIVVDEAICNMRAPVQTNALPELAGILNDALPIETTEICKGFELFWKHYAAYLVTEECVGSCGDTRDETYTGEIIRVYSESHFLQHLAKDTSGHSAPLQHYKLICLNHLIDVASYVPPEISLLAPNLQRQV